MTIALAGHLQQFTSAILRIGNNYTNNDPFYGAIDEVRIYNRALSAAEIRWLLPTDVKSSRSLPFVWLLKQNYPNPFNPSTTIEYQLPTRGNIQIKVYNSIGQLVKALVDGKYEEPGNHSIGWDGRNNAGDPVSSGTYFYQIRVDDQMQAKKMLLLK